MHAAFFLAYWIEFISARAFSALNLFIKTSLFRPVSPRIMDTDDFGTEKSRAMNSISASLALPSTGGAASATASAPLRSPFILFLAARGVT